MTTVLLAVCAVIPALMAFGCYLSDLPAFAGAGLSAAFLLAMCVWGHLWVPAVVCAVWVAGAVWRLVVAFQRPRSKPAVWPVPRREHERILRDAAERLADDDEIASVVRRWQEVV